MIASNPRESLRLSRIDLSSRVQPCIAPLSPANRTTALRLPPNPSSRPHGSARAASVAATLILSGLVAARPVYAQAGAPANAGDAIARDQARRAAEADAAERAARQASPEARLNGGERPALGAFPVETPCFTIREIAVEGALPPRLRWVGRHLAQFRGRCAGQAGLSYILASTQAEFLDRGLVTTRAGLPEQDLSTGVLRVAIVPGVVSALRGGTPKARRAWNAAAPLGVGDLVDLRALEQGLEQMRRVPGRQVTVDLAPGVAPGETVLDLKAAPARAVSGSVSVNNFAGRTVNRFQATGQLAALDLLGVNDVLSVYYNSRLDSPSTPADSRGTGGSFSVPYGWWTFGAAASANRYEQRVIGQVQDFDSRGKLDTASVFAERVVNRDQTSRTSVQLQLGVRRARSFIDDVEIGLQRQKLTDVQVALFDRRSLGRVRLDSQIAYRRGVDLFGAQDDEPGQPRELPTARYGIGTLDMALSAALTDRVGYRAAFRVQISDRALYGPDLFSVGGPYTVRGYESDRSLLSRSGFYLRQEATYRVSDAVQPYALVDVGRVRGDDATPLGLGAGVRASHSGFFVDAYAAAPVTARRLTRDRRVQLGLAAGFGF